MANNNNIGPKRLVVGAHYGMKDWLAQRVTAVVMALYTIIVLIGFLTAGGFNYESWVAFFGMTLFKIATFTTFMVLFYHVWVGIRDIWMDYVKSVALRLTLQMATMLWLIGCAGYAARIIWRI
jgi:succinate dehydrogenase / fumarate reductase membrane anchor subunit